nr:hypothetical protein [Corynebacterium sp. UBA5992]
MVDAAITKTLTTYYPDIEWAACRRTTEQLYAAAEQGSGVKRVLGVPDVRSVGRLLLLSERELVVPQRHIRLADDAAYGRPVDPEPRGDLSGKGFTGIGFEQLCARAGKGRFPCKVRKIKDFNAVDWFEKLLRKMTAKRSRQIFADSGGFGAFSVNCGQELEAASDRERRIYRIDTHHLGSTYLRRCQKRRPKACGQGL